MNKENKFEEFISNKDNIENAVDASNKEQREMMNKESDYIKKMDNEQNFCITIVQSPQWRKWDKVAHLRGWDSSESAECGWLSKEHLQAFFKFVIEKNQKDTLKEIEIYMDKIKNK